MIKFFLPFVMLMFTKSKWLQSFWFCMLISLMYMFYLPWMTFNSLNLIWSFDNMSIFLNSLTSWITGLMIMMSWTILIKKDNNNFFLTMLLLLQFFLLFCFFINNWFFFFFVFEATLFPIFFMIILWGYQPERLEASTFLILYMLIASVPFFLMIILSFSLSNTFFMFFIQNIFFNWFSIFFFIAFLTKIPMYCFHLWLPKAHVEAPVAGSMILAAILLKLGGYGLMRIMNVYPEFKNYLSFFFSLSLWGGILSSLICLRQTDLKSLIAYSSVSHMAMLIACIFINKCFSVNGILLIMLAHGFTSSALFSLASIIYDQSKTRNLILNKGLLIINPSITIFWLLLCFANMSGPPSINLMSELIMMMSILSININSVFYLIMLIFLSGAFSLFLYTMINHGNLNFSNNFSSFFNFRFFLCITLHMLPIFFSFLMLNIFL